MGKILAVVLGLAVVAGAAYFALKSGGPRSAGEIRQLQEAEVAPELKRSAGTPKERLDNVHNAAQRLGDEAQKNADKAAEVQ